MNRHLRKREQLINEIADMVYYQIINEGMLDVDGNLLDEGFRDHLTRASRYIRKALTGAGLVLTSLLPLKAISQTRGPVVNPGELTHLVDSTLKKADEAVEALAAAGYPIDETAGSVEEFVDAIAQDKSINLDTLIENFSNLDLSMQFTYEIPNVTDSDFLIKQGIPLETVKKITNKPLFRTVKFDAMSKSIEFADHFGPLDSNAEFQDLEEALDNLYINSEEYLLIMRSVKNNMIAKVSESLLKSTGRAFSLNRYTRAMGRTSAELINIIRSMARNNRETYEEAIFEFTQMELQTKAAYLPGATGNQYFDLLRAILKYPDLNPYQASIHLGAFMEKMDANEHGGADITFKEEHPYGGDVFVPRAYH